jgi:hypothetical protein
MWQAVGGIQLAAIDRAVHDLPQTGETKQTVA